MSDPAANRAAALAACALPVVRAMRATVPAPRGAPWYGLDLEVPFAPVALASLSEPGIFRKYERVLLLGAPLGGTARWLAAHLGCRVVVAAPDPVAVAFGGILHHGARGEEGVVFCRGAEAALPVRGRAFTHVWRIGAPAEPAAVLAQAFAAVRPGGHVAVQLLPGEEAVAEALPDAAVAAGFESVTLKSIAVAEWPSVFHAARARARAAVGDESLVPAATRLWGTPAAPPPRLPQFHARRPS